MFSLPTNWRFNKVEIDLTHKPNESVVPIVLAFSLAYPYFFSLSSGLSERFLLLE